MRYARRSGAALTVTILLGFAGGLAAIGQARLLSQIINRVFLGGQSLEGEAGPFIFLLLVIAARAALIYGSGLSAHAVASKVKMDLRTALFTRLQRLGPGYLSAERTGELVNTATEGIEALDAYFSQYLPQLALAALTPLAVLVFVFPLDWLSGLALALTGPLIPVFMILIGSMAESLTSRQWKSLSRMSAYFLDVVQGLPALKLLGRSKDQVQMLARVSNNYREATMRVLRVTFLSALALELAATLSTALVAVEIGLRLLYGQLGFEQALFVLVLAPEFYLPLRLLGARFHAGMSGAAAGERIFGILADPGLADVPSVVLPERPLKLDFPIAFSRVHYTYPDGRQAVRGVSFELGEGQSLALVGPSGAGKSSLAQLLLRFMEPQNGTILAGGKPVSEIPPEVWRSQVTWVPQNPYLFNESVLANLRMGHSNASREAVERAAIAAGAHEVICQLPDGYDTIIGERGARLSGGQAQLLALARAFLKDAPLVILDEATSNLDPEIEARLVDASERLLKGRAALIIAHRLSTARRADSILVMDGGRVMEMGTHAFLLSSGGIYASLLQASGRQF